MSPRPDPKKKKVFSKRQRLRYLFDNTLSRGSTSLILWLGAITFALIVAAATLSAGIGIPDPNTGREIEFGEAFWLGLLRALDPGTMGSDVGWPFRLISLFVTLGGVLIAGSLIAVLASAINRRVEVLQGGRSIVAEYGHTLILGWSSKIFTIVSELVVANENQPGASIVILSAEGKASMEEQIGRRVPNARGTRIICRTGAPQDFADLRVVNIAMAKSVIVLSSPTRDGDAGVVKATLAVVKGPWELDPTVPVVAELAGSDNAEALRGATDGRVTVVESSRLIARLTAQVCRQPGLSQVYTELLDFDGDEIYFHGESALVGRPFAEALLAFDGSTVIGVKSGDGRVTLNPPLDRPIGDDESLVVIASDDDAVVFSGASALDARPSKRPAVTVEPEDILLIGWNPLAPLVLKELDTYVAPESTVTALVDVTLVPPEELDLDVGLDCFRVEFVHGPIPGDELEALMARDYDHAIVLCYRQGITEAEADARVLLTLLQIRGAIQRTGHDTNIVAELLDERDVALAQSAGVDEFIVSERLTSLVMAQLSENVGLQPVFEDLLDAEGAEVYLKPVSLYSSDGHAKDFAGMVTAAAARGETAIGYKLDGEVRLNPPKSGPVALSDDALVVVLAEDEA